MDYTGYDKPDDLKGVFSYVIEKFSEFSKEYDGCLFICGIVYIINVW